MRGIKLSQLHDSGLEGGPRQQAQVSRCHGDGVLHVLQHLLADLVQHRPELLFAGVHQWHHRRVQVEGVWKQNDDNQEDFPKLLLAGVHQCQE